MAIPANLRWLEGREDGRVWLRSLPDRVQRAAGRWSLTLGPVFDGAHVSYACPAVTVDGAEVVLKVQFPHEDCRTEAEALQAWGGSGAIRLLDHDAPDWALLLERCRPGDRLATSHLALPETIEIMAGLTEETWVAPPTGHAFASLADHAHGWCAKVEADWVRLGQPVPRSWVDLAIGCLREVADDQGEQVVVNQDLHDDNVISASRRPWLIIDPKPLVGERALAAAPILRSIGFRHGPTAAVASLGPLCDRLALDPGRVLRWAVGQSICWGMDGTATVDARGSATVRALVEQLRATS